MKESVSNKAAFTEAKEVLSYNEIKEQYGVVDYTEEHPSVYCGTYGKYNDGSLFGMWLDLTKFKDYDEFMDICRQLHADEEDPEFMYQDYECFPRSLYCESCMGEDTFNKIIEYANLDENEQEAFEDFLDFGFDFDMDKFHDVYQGHFDTEEDFAEYIVSECYDLDNMMGSLSFYFDYEKFARDLFMSDYHYGDHGHVFRAY